MKLIPRDLYGRPHIYLPEVTVTQSDEDREALEAMRDMFGMDPDYWREFEEQLVANLQLKLLTLPNEEKLILKNY